MANSKIPYQQIVDHLPKSWLMRGCLAYVVFMLFLIVVGGIASIFLPTPPKPPEMVAKVDVPKADVKPQITEAKVRVDFHNETKNRPLDKKSEIWFRHHGAWWLSTVNYADFKVLGPRPINVKLEKDETLVLYPNGRGKDDTGQRIDIPIMLTEDMNPEGSQRDAVIIEIYDDKVVMFGAPIKAATGKTEMVVPRQ